MRKTTQMENENKLLVDINGLQAMLSIGRNTAATVGEKAGAVVRIGRRRLYNVAKVVGYLEQITEV